MNCPGSSVLLKKLALPETDDPDYRRDGVAAHEVAAKCLAGGGDAWEFMDGKSKFNGVEVSQNMADAVQSYLDHCRPIIAEASIVLIEKRIGGNVAKRPHPDFFGTVDFAALVRGKKRLVVRDYKHGEGIVVEAERNVQMMYYGYGIILDENIPDEYVVDLGIVQPRAYHDDGPIRLWETTAGEIKKWAETVLLPAMEAAEVDETFDTGKWCRFCPAKLLCPLLTGLFGAAAKANPAAVPNFSHQRLGLEYKQREAVKFYLKALEDETFRRLNIGQPVPGAKLVLKQAKRVWAEGARDLFVKEFGDEAIEPGALKSPAQMETIGPKAKALVQQHAYMPATGFTVADESSSKPAVKVERVADVFSHMISDYVPPVDMAGLDNI